MTVDEPHRVLGQQVRHVPLFVHRLVVVAPVPLADALLREVVDRRVVAHELREAPAQRVVLAVEVAQVPLAEDAAVLVTGTSQHFRQGDLRRVETVVPPRRDHRPHQTETDRVAAGHQPRPRRRADGSAVEALDQHPCGRDAVDVRGRDLAAVEADVVASEIVGDDENDVREDGRWACGVRGRVANAGGEEKGRGGECERLEETKTDRRRGHYPSRLHAAATLRATGR